MKVEVVVFATLRKYVPGLAIGESKWVNIHPGATIAEVIETIGLPGDQVKVIMRNHRQAQLSDTLIDGDRIAFIPAVGGG